MPRIPRVTDHIARFSMSYSNQWKNVLSIKKRFALVAPLENSYTHHAFTNITLKVYELLTCIPYAKFKFLH